MNASDFVKRLRKYEPPKQGVYALVQNGKVIYIGCSVDPVFRIGRHAQDGVVFDEAFYVSVDGGHRELGEAERLLIEHFRPCLNKSGLTSGHSWGIERKDNKQRKPSILARRQQELAKHSGGMEKAASVLGTTAATLFTY